MSPRIVGPSGKVVDVDESIASGLVAGGHCKYVDGEPAKSAETGKNDDETQQKPPQGDGGGPDAQKPADDTKGSETGDGDSTSAKDPEGDGGADDKRPAGNASRDVWVEYATAQGKTEDELTGLKQTEIRALFDTPDE